MPESRLYKGTTLAEEFRIHTQPKDLAPALFARFANHNTINESSLIEFGMDTMIKDYRAHLVKLRAKPVTTDNALEIEETERFLAITREELAGLQSNDVATKQRLVTHFKERELAKRDADRDSWIPRRVLELQLSLYPNNDVDTVSTPPVRTKTWMMSVGERLEELHKLELRSTREFMGNQFVRDGSGWRAERVDGDGA